jgi:hypothetical protein
MHRGLSRHIGLIWTRCLHLLLMRSVIRGQSSGAHVEMLPALPRTCGRNSLQMTSSVSEAIPSIAAPTLYVRVQGILNPSLDPICVFGPDIPDHLVLMDPLVLR